MYEYVMIVFVSYPKIVVKTNLMGRQDQGGIYNNRSEASNSLPGLFLVDLSLKCRFVMESAVGWK